jgi:hypothetical protein
MQIFFKILRRRRLHQIAQARSEFVEHALVHAIPV